MNENMIELLGYIAGILGMLSFIPQLIKTIKTKRADDLSMSMLWICLVTNACYIAYGTMLELTPIVVTLSISSVIIICQMYFTLKYKLVSDSV